MRYQEGHKEKTHQRILHKAIQQMKSYGVEGVSIDQLMGELNLTRGGFYAHFKSKEALIAEACTISFEEAYSYLLQNFSHLPAPKRLGAYVEMYLSKAHIEKPAHGCPIPSLAAEVGRSSKKVKQAFEKGVEQQLKQVAHWAEVRWPQQKAGLLHILSSMAGTIALARAMDSKEIQFQLLNESKKQLKNVIGSWYEAKNQN